MSVDTQYENDYDIAFEDNSSDYSTAIKKEQAIKHVRFNDIVQYIDENNEVVNENRSMIHQAAVTTVAVKRKDDDDDNNEHRRTTIVPLYRQFLTSYQSIIR